MYHLIIKPIPVLEFPDRRTHEALFFSNSELLSNSFSLSKTIKARPNICIDNMRVILYFTSCWEAYTHTDRM